VELAAPAVSQQRQFFSFKKKPQVGFVGIEGLHKAADFPPLAEKALQRSRDHLQGVQDKTATEVVESLDSVSNDLCQIADAAELCRNLHPAQEYVASASDAVNLIQSFMSEVNLDSGLYQQMLKSEERDDFDSLSLEVRAVLQHMRVSMEMEGIHLQAEEKKQCLALLEKEQELSFDIVQRQEHLRRGQQGSEVWVPVSGLEDLPQLRSFIQSERRRYGSSADKVCLPPDANLLEGVLARSSCSQTRRLCYEALEQPDPEGDAAIVELMLVRQSLARLRGYPTWNHYSQREALIGNPDNVEQFLRSTWDKVRPMVSADLQSLARTKELLGGDDKSLNPWDYAFLQSACKAEAAGATAGTRHMSEFLSFPALMQGVSVIASRMLDLQVVAEDTANGEVWHNTVQKFTLRPAGSPDEVIGILYMDPFTRDGKTVRSAQFTLQGSKTLSDGSRQVPVAALVFSLPPGGQGMTLGSAVTFMHEIGHALHSLLSETAFQHLSGTRGTVDFVEFPSHLFEHYVLDSNCLSAYASHYRTGEAPSEAEKIAYDKNRTHLATIEVLEQLLYSTVDQAFYSYLPSSYKLPRDGSLPLASPDIVQDTQASVASALAQFDAGVDAPLNAPLSQILRLGRASRFDHLVHYGGSYYCYIFNRVLSSHIWQQAFKTDPFNEDCGRRLRNFFAKGSVVQNLSVIQELCPGAEPFTAASVPQDAFLAQLSPKAGL